MVQEATKLHQIGRYEVLEEIGRGAMGIVFKARDPLIERTVAVKTITAGIADDPDLLQRFRREAKAAGGLQHPNIVTIYEMSDSEGLPFIVMEYLEGESLERVISRKLPMPVAQRLGHMVQACRALDYAHRRGIIHRDIKPANIMVTREGVVKVVDFGIARIIDAGKTQTGALVGTLSYMPPELLHGQRADQRSDIWSLGTVLYEVLTYRRAFEGENHAAVMMSILQHEPRGIGDFVPECPPELDTVVRRALHKDPALRYQTVEALLVDLEPIWTWLQKETVQNLVRQGRQLMETGKLAEASEVLRQSLLIDTANLTARGLFDHVNVLLGRDPAFQQSRKQAGEVQDRDRSTTAPPAGIAPRRTLDDTVAETVASTPQRTSSGEPDSNQRDQSGPSAAKPPGGQNQNQQNGTPAILATQEVPIDRAASAAGQSSAIVRTVASPLAVPRPAPTKALASPRFRGLQPPPERNRTPIYAIGAILLLFALGAFGYSRFSSLRNVFEGSSVSQPAPDPAPISESVPPSDTTPAPIEAKAQPASANARPDPAPPAPVTSPVSAPAPAAAPTPASTAVSSPVSVEDQQRHLIDLAHEAADSRNYKAAQARLDDAAKLDGPLNPLIANLRRSFSEEAHGAELQQSARKEQSLWDQAMKDIQGNRLDDADELLRELLTLPEGGHRVTDAEKYVDQVIPQQRHQEDLWTQAQAQSSSNEPGHLLEEVKSLDQLLAEGGAHEQEARQMRDSVMKQFARGNARKNHTSLPTESVASEAKLAQLEDQYFKSVEQGDAKALEQLQQLRPQFKAMIEGGGLLAANARDYQNNLIPKAQKAIEDRLANEESAAAANAAYGEAIEQFDQAVATENLAALRSHVLPEFQQIFASGGPRAQEAARYVNTLIPKALKDQPSQ
jgi:predicted Ser/Thr protein kinase